uniref:DNA-directed DNA polymerase n=1 Tax=Meloidogyne javanica TaxID=6303 RepID=A0A915LLH1_MELJA
MEPTTKRPRFFIEEIFADNPEIFQSGSGDQIFSDQNLEESFDEETPSTSLFTASQYIKKLDQNVEFNNKFKFIKNKSSFLIENIPNDFELLLTQIFKYCFDTTIIECEEKQLKADRIGCLISSELLNPEIWIPIREINENTIDSMLNRFNQIAQSKSNDNITLFGKPFNITFTAVSRKDLPNERRITGGTNIRSRKRMAPMHHKINNQCLIKIENLNGLNHCLFYSLQATLYHNIKGWPRWKFYDYLHSKHGQRGELNEHGHVCNERYCQNCKAFHSIDRGCFIQQINVKTPKPYRIVSFDVETMQHNYIENQQNKRNHQINFIGAKVVCASCIENGNWKLNLKENNNICQVVCCNPIEKFVDWILFELPMKYQTFVFSHNGGRFDMVLIFREIFLRRLNPSMIRKV